MNKTIRLVIISTLLFFISGCDKFDKSKTFEKVDNISKKEATLEKKEKESKNKSLLVESQKKVDINKPKEVEAVIKPISVNNNEMQYNQEVALSSSNKTVNTSNSSISFSIDIDDTNKELVEAVENLKENYNSKIVKINKFYHDKKNELENNFQKKVNDAKDNLSTLVNTFEQKCKIFNSENITHCKSLKNTIEESRNIIDKGDYELKIMREKLNKSQEQELASELILFQKNLLNIKNSFIYK